MAANLKAVWPMSLSAPAGSLEAKQPEADDGLDVPDPARYYSREFMEKEWKFLWPRVWLLAGVTSDIPEAGDYTVFNHGHESFVIVRQEDGGIRAFYNACPHRANPIALNERGSVAKFTCAFHAWRFCIDGKLDCITDEHSFEPKLVEQRPGLTQARCDQVGGLIFINMDGKAPPLREWIGLPPGYIENYQIDKMHVVRHVRTEWQANWKTGVDAFYETYHLPHIHPQTQGVMEDYSQYDTYPNGFQRMIVPICTPSHRMHDRENVNEGLQYMMIEAGMDPGARVMDPASVTLAWDDLLEAFLRERLDTDTPGSAVAAYVVAAGPAAEGKLRELAKAVAGHRTARGATGVPPATGLRPS